MRTEPPRTLVLLRHAKSAWPEGVPDHDRPLAGRGRRDAPAAGQWLRQAGHIPDLVLCSTAARARQTWQLAEAEIGARSPVTFEPEVYGATADILLNLIRRLPAAARTVVVVGHDPALPELALSLAGGPGGQPPPAAGADADRMRVKFPTAAMAVLEIGGGWAEVGPGAARLAGFITPRDLHAN
ncbi:MAG: histidine phosphatase family protein [Actinomycetota bacterium]|nr:histidine phosphatase family protein [Actinomycetota bacterium]